MCSICFAAAKLDLDLLARSQTDKAYFQLDLEK